MQSSPSFTNGSCAAGYYFTERSQQSPTCHECTNCTLLHKQELTSCNHTHDSTCGPCLPGYFLGAVSDREVLCQKCSKCPPEGAGTATRWKDCQRAGLDSDMWCSPGNDFTATPSSYKFHDHILQAMWSLKQTQPLLRQQLLLKQEGQYWGQSPSSKFPMRQMTRVPPQNPPHGYT